MNPIQDSVSSTFTPGKSNFLAGLWRALAFGLVFALQAGVSANAATTRSIDVDNVDDDNPGGGCTLREAIDLANAAALPQLAPNGCAVVHQSRGTGSPITYVIELPDAPYTYTLIGASDEDGNASGDLDILALLTFPGSELAYSTVIVGDWTDPDGTIIQGGTSSINGIDRVFDIHVAANVTLEDLTIRYGNASGAHGGGIHLSSGSTLNLAHSSVRNNFASGLGGGIYSAGGSTLNLINSTVDNNIAQTGGGGISNGGLRLNTSPVATLINSTVSNNWTPGFGGGIHNAAPSSTLNLTNSTLSDNYAGKGRWRYLEWWRRLACGHHPRQPCHDDRGQLHAQ
jgi:CSLREA domain-containing protein